MFYRSEEFNNFLIQTPDGELGKLKDFLLDDLLWVTRYLVGEIEISEKLKKIIIAPSMIKKINLSRKQILIDSTIKRFLDGPKLENEEKVVRKYEKLFLEYHDLPFYWEKKYVQANTVENLLKNGGLHSNSEPNDANDSYLRSCSGMTRFRIQSNDGKFGEISGFLLEYPLLTVRYVVVDTGSYLPGRKVIIPTNWIYFVNFEEKKVSVDLSIEDIKECPKLNPMEPVNREYEIKFFDYFERPKYWI